MTQKELYKAIEEELNDDFPNAGHIMGIINTHVKEVMKDVCMLDCRECDAIAYENEELRAGIEEEK